MEEARLVSRVQISGHQLKQSDILISQLVFKSIQK